jgi:hypothetical protein
MKGFNFAYCNQWFWIMEYWGCIDKDIDPMKDSIDVHAVELKYWHTF